MNIYVVHGLLKIFFFPQMIVFLAIFSFLLTFLDIFNLYLKF